MRRAQNGQKSGPLTGPLRRRLRRPRAPLFLARPSYRRRRLRDAARLLPVFAVLFVILPLLWTPPGSTLRDTAGDVVYFFGIWVAMILCAAAFAPGLSASADQDDETEDDTGYDAGPVSRDEV